MPDIADFLGSSLQPQKRWTSGAVEISEPSVGQVPAEELRVDPFLPVLAADPYDPAVGIAIPAGRFVAVGSTEPLFGQAFDTTGAVASTGVSAFRQGQSSRGKTLLTIHDGKDLRPVGMSVNNIFRSTAQYSSGNFVQSGPFMGTGDTFGTDSGQSSSDTKFRKGFFAAVPFVLQINNANGTLQSGDSVTGYWGSTTSTSVIGWVHRGKPVKHVPKRLVVHTQAATTSGTLAAAIYPHIQPNVVFMQNAGTAVTGSVTLAWNGTAWDATWPSAVTTVFYEYGQEADQIAGQVVRIQSLQDIKSREELFKFVEVARNDWMNYPPMTQQQAVVSRTTEAATAIVAGNVYRVVNAPISINHQCIVEVQGTVVDPTTGTSTSYSAANWYTLPGASNLAITAGLYGPYHSVNWRTGVIELSVNIVATAVRVTYSSIADRRSGAVIWGRGTEGMTDGRYVTSAPNAASVMVPSNRAGIPAHLNFADIVGEMRVLVK